MMAQSAPFIVLVAALLNTLSYSFAGNVYCVTPTATSYSSCPHNSTHCATLSEEGPPNDGTQLNTDYMVGDYYWATTGYLYFLKPQSKWGLEYFRIKHTKLKLKSKAKKPGQDTKAKTRSTSAKLEDDTEKTDEEPESKKKTKKLGCNFLVYSPITTFLPGGWAVIRWPTFYRWKLIEN